MLRIFKSQVNVCAGQHGFDDVRGPGDGYLRLKRNPESLAVSAETNWNKLASQSTPLREVWPRPSRAERGGLHLIRRGIQRVALARECLGLAAHAGRGAVKMQKQHALSLLAEARGGEACMQQICPVAATGLGRL